MTPTDSPINHTSLNQVKSFLLQLQSDLCKKLEAQEKDGSFDGNSNTTFLVDEWERITNGVKQGGGRSNVMADGKVVEKAGVMFSHIHIDNLPASASARYPELAGAKAEAMGVSVVIHPRNPYIPTSHMNVRLFVAYPENKNKDPIWWFGGGFDLTPFYPTQEECVAWHQNCFDICEPFGEDVYSTFKTWCDQYFYIKHRDEQRGIGGLFYDDLNTLTQVGNTWDFDTCFNFMKAVGMGYVNSLMPLFDANKHKAYTEQERNFQLYRRGRYVEYNLIYDRGTTFGLQSGGRVESILVSLPNMVSWHYKKEYAQGSAEHKLTDYFLKVRDWL